MVRTFDERPPGSEEDVFCCEQQQTKKKKGKEISSDGGGVPTWKSGGAVCNDADILPVFLIKH